MHGPAGEGEGRRCVTAGAYAHPLDRIDLGLAKGRIEASLPDGTRRTLGGRAAGPSSIPPSAGDRKRP